MSRSWLQPSGTLRVAERAAALRAAGIAVADFAGSRPEDAAPAFLREALHRAADDGFNFLTGAAGISELRAALARALAREYGITADPDGEILVTVGAKYAVYLALMACVGPGDEVLLLDPSWVSYDPAVRLAGATPVPVPMRVLPDGRSALDPEALASRIGPATRMVLLNTPHNPTGAVFDEAALRAVGRAAARADAWVLVDESFAKIVYPGARHVSLAALEEGRGRTLTVQSFSKSYVMPGLRVGVLAGPRAVVERAALVQQHTTTCAPSQGQLAALAALDAPAAFFDALRDSYLRKRDLVVGELNRIRGVRCVPPDGAFYAFPDCSALGESSAALADRLLEEAHVAVVPGAAFGARGEGHLRLTFTRSLEELSRGLARVRAVLGR
ncbi:MAG TPA: aminotransferase class I/II-fold pyridoxal phosphate-dependent enzyme [Thermodesulfobacteriota bacterium]